MSDRTERWAELDNINVELQMKLKKKKTWGKNPILGEWVEEYKILIFVTWGIGIDVANGD